MGGEEKKVISQEAAISRDAFVRAWSHGSFEEQGEMLFDLLGESVIVRLRAIEEKQREHERRLGKAEECDSNFKDDIEQFKRYTDKKIAYITGGIAVLAALAGPIAMILGQAIF